MTNTVHRGQPDNTVKPVIFSHEATDEPATRQAGEQARHVQFSAHGTEGTPRPQP